jgi:hypothetical protein
LALSAFAFASAGSVLVGSNLEFVEGLAFIFSTGEEFPGEEFEEVPGLEELGFFADEGFD